MTFGFQPVPASTPAPTSSSSSESPPVPPRSRPIALRLPATTPCSPSSLSIQAARARAASPGMGIPTTTCIPSPGGKVYTITAVDPVMGGSLQLLGEADATLQIGQRYYLKAGNESVVSCNGASYIKAQVSKQGFWVSRR